MSKKQLVDYAIRILNGEDIGIIEYAATDSVDDFRYKTVKRLIRAHELFRNNSDYIGDFLIAFRDYMITFDMPAAYHLKALKDIENYGMSYDVEEESFFATLQAPKYVNDSFVNDAFIKKESKKNKTVEGLLTDPMIYELTGYTHFKSMDQKLAVYGALNTPNGYTTLVSLPTGGGKSLVTQTISYQKDGLTIVIVPTVSLAIDQERVTKTVIKNRDNENEIFCYSSGVSAGPIIKAINDKKAKILFISPEAILENPGFAEAIKDANKGRYLKNVVIDEAHIVVDWGASFRVDYQFLEAWRNMLLMTNPGLRTVLLSATFEDKCVDILKNLFEIDGKWVEIRCDALRHEPRFCVDRAKDYEEKQKHILELIRKLPHPMIVYVSRPAEAEQIKKMLSNNGIRNARTFTGLTGSAQRRQLIDEWVDDQFEIMIATSAFGVGVDKPDVRTVLHTYIPQNANTYYQELGRGGRDRLPCLSVVCLQPEDTTIGRDRINKRVLTSKKIVDRWDSLYNNDLSKRVSNNRVFIDTTIKPNYSGADEFDDSPTSDADMNWNIYVLLFLRRYNLIRIMEVKIENGHYMILIEIKDERLLSIDDTLRAHIDELRGQEWNYYSSSYNRISESLRKNSIRCISELFYDTYSRVYEYCAGCNNHNYPIVGDSHKFPLKKRVTEPLRTFSEEQLRPFGDSTELAVSVTDNSIVDVVNRLAGKGLSTIVIPDNYEDSMELLQIGVKRNLLIISFSDMFNLQKCNAYYYTSGLICVVYSDNENDIGSQYLAIKNNVCGKPSTRVLHIIKRNVYISELGKNILELIDGPSILTSALYA
ncbi:ATP-dependent DNA helicase RecQ [Lachnospiraceae bacterium XBB2008]|nr:ATP-dependent DNA helicase RecQ [Lachnospiraceae bacterium XBB2008]